MYTQKKPATTQRWSDIISLCLMFLLFVLASSRLQITHWTEHMEAAGWLLMVGAAFGFAVGKTRFRALFSFLIITFYSIVTVPSIFLFITTDRPGISEKVNELIDRIVLAGTQLAGNQPVTDSILFIVGMGLLFWIVGTAAGFTMARTATPWIPLIILGGALLMIEHFQGDSRKIFYTWAYAVVSLILLGRIYYLKLRRNLQTQGIQVGEETNFEFTRGVFIAAVILGLAGWVTPNIYRTFIPGTDLNTRFSERWDSFASQFEHLVFALEQAPSSVEDAAAGNLELGTGQQLGEDQVLYVEANRPEPLNHQFYWRIRTYDLYEGGKWSTDSIYKRFFVASETLPFVSFSGQEAIDFKFTSYLPKLIMLYAPGQPRKFNVQLDASITNQGDNFADIVAFYTSPVIRYGGSYQVETEISTATADQLSKAGEDYPQWIKDRYLQLPSDMSSRITDLSRQLTAGLEDPFTKTATITNYLRSNITYQTSIATPPTDQDVIDWFLFDYKKGFCNYSATAEVLLLRSAGIPARLAVGYTQGEQTDITNQYLVREKHSHAWPEVYFPHYGWIAFEPTGAQPDINYVATMTGTGGVNQGGEGQTGTTRIPSRLRSGEDRAMRLLDEMETGAAEENPVRPPLSTVGKVLIAVLSILAAGLIAFLGFRIRKNSAEITQSIVANWRRFYRNLTRIPGLGDCFILMKLSPVERCFWPIERGLRWAQEEMPEGITAHEMAARFVEIYPDTGEDVDYLLTVYQEAVYGKNLADLSDARKVGARLNKKIYKATFQKITKPIRRLNERFGG